MDDQNSPDFYPSKAIILSELSTKDKDHYYELLLKNKVAFYRI
jgi:hypothetical protein